MKIPRLSIPWHSNLDSMNDLQTSACHPCDKHPIHTAYKQQAHLCYKRIKIIFYQQRTISSELYASCQVNKKSNESQGYTDLLLD